MHLRVLCLLTRATGLSGLCTVPGSGEPAGNKTEEKLHLRVPPSSGLNCSPLPGSLPTAHPTVLPGWVPCSHPPALTTWAAAAWGQVCLPHTNFP